MPHWHFFISSYYLTVLHLFSLTTLKSEEFTLSSGSFNWGRYIIRCTLVSHWHFLISPYSLRCHTDISLYLPITWLFWICSHWLHWKVKSSPLSSGQFQMGGYIVRCTWCHTDMSLYLPIIWLFRIALIDHIEKVKSPLWALAVSMGGVYGKMYLVSHWHFLISSYYLTVLNGLLLTTLKSESSLWALAVLNGEVVNHQIYPKSENLTSFQVFLISSYYLTVSNGLSLTGIEKWRVHSELWQFWMGGVNCQIYPKSENLSLFQVFLISSYYLTVSNGLSVTALKSEEFTLRSGSFKWGGVNCQIYPKSENLSSFQVLLLLHRALSFL